MAGRESFRYEKSEGFALKMDESDPLKGCRDLFHIPRSRNGGAPLIYFVGNSLGLQPKKAKEYVDQELADWALLGCEGHFRAKNAWYSYHELLTEQTARLVGARPIEVVVMNTLTVNLHLMMVSFYRPTPERNGILIEAGAFPSDRYAVASQIRFHGYDPRTSLIELTPRKGEDTLRTEDVLSTIRRGGGKIALVLLGGVNYLTGQAFDMQAIAAEAEKRGCAVGFDLAHAAGNLVLSLHDWGVDFAVWCSYKYLNSGPGGLSGCFVHERHGSDRRLPRFEGWWGHNKDERFKMSPVFDPIRGAEGWQLSNPPILEMASLRASMEIFDAAGMGAIRRKGDLLTGYLEFLLEDLPDGAIHVITPRSARERGSQLSFSVRGDFETAEALVARLHSGGALCDFREPNVIRVAPAPLYNRFHEVYRFVEVLKNGG